MFTLVTGNFMLVVNYKTHPPPGGQTSKSILLIKLNNGYLLIAHHYRIIILGVPSKKQHNWPALQNTLKSLINKQGGYVVFLVLRTYSFIRDFRVGSFFGVSILKRNGNKDLMIAKVFDVK